MNKIFYAQVAALMCVSAAFSQPSSRFTRVPIDSVQIDGYRAVRMELRTADGEKATEELSLFKGDKKVMSSFGHNIALYNFGSAGPDSTGKLFAKDINGDSLPEAFITAFTESGFCCNYLSIISLGDELSEIARFELKETDIFYLEDIDGDSIPELLFRDPGFIEWHSYTFEDAPRPLLIWKWREGQYILANNEFSGYLTDQIQAEDLQKLDKQVKQWQKQAEKSGTDAPSTENTPPPELLEVVLDYYYAGMDTTADSLLDANWPENIPGKEEFHGELLDQLNQSPYWKNLHENSLGTNENQ